VIAAITRLPGLVLMAFSALAFSLMAASIKVATTAGIPPSEIIFVRGLICSVLTLLAMRAARVAPLGNRTGMLVLRGILGFSGLFLYSTAIESIPLPDAIALQYTHPIFAAAFAGYFLKEKMPRNSGLAIAICAAGALVILNPQGSGNLQGNLIGLASGVASGLAYTTVRTLSRTESPLTIMLSFHAVACVCGAILMTTEFVVPTGRLWLWLIGIALISQIGQWLLTHGLRKERAGVATTVGYLAIAFGAVWAWIFFGEAITWPIILGTTLMVTGLLLLAKRGKVPVNFVSDTKL
jgi:drug/metabolite transporter (DMT)-like permease